MRTAVSGPAYLLRGLAFVRQRPRLWLLGMVPALLVFCLLAGLFVLLVLRLGALVGWATGFADDWADPVRVLLRVLLGLALLVGAWLLATSVFVGLTLAVGDPFYERIWRATETALGGPVPDQGLGFWRSARDGAGLAAVGVGCSVLVMVAGFVPVVGPLAGILLGTALSGRLLGHELLGRPLEARGLDADARAGLVAPHRSRVLGFGVATQLTFLVPLGAVLMMPAAVAGATMLARDVLDGPTA